MFATLSVKDLYDGLRIVEARAHVNRVTQWLHGTWPAIAPPLVTGAAALSDLATLAALPATTVAIDTEFDWNRAQVPGCHTLTMLGLAWYDGTQYHTAQFTPKDDWNRVWETLRPVIAAHTTLFQNAAADVPVIAYNGGPVWADYRRVDDLMLAHATLYAGWPHDLKYLRSIGGYLNLPKVFREAAGNMATYNQGDVYETLRLAEDLLPAAAADTGLHRTYRVLIDLVPIHTQATQRGVHVYAPAVVNALELHLTDITAALHIAQAYTGVEMPLSGKKFTEWLVNVDGVKGVINKRTHKVTWDKDAISTLRHRYLALDAEHEAKHPLTVTTVLERIDAGAHPLLEARALYSRVYQSFTHYIKPLLKGEADVEADDLADNGDLEATSTHGEGEGLC
ncbi:MAG: hypothetical protein ACRCZI_00225 [Cetobacterium sp.]